MFARIPKRGQDDDAELAIDFPNRWGHGVRARTAGGRVGGRLHLMASDAERFAAELPPASDGSRRGCLEVQCGIPLAAETVHERICVLSSPKHEAAQRSALTDGTTRLQRVLGWVRQAAAACGATQAAGRPVLGRELRQALVRGQG